MKKKAYVKPEVTVTRFDSRDSVTVNVSAYQVNLNRIASNKINRGTVIDF